MNQPPSPQTAPQRDPLAAPRPRASVHAHGPAGDDADLVRRIRAGDGEALGELHGRWSPLVYSLALRIVGDADDAEEVVEEAFWQAWRQADRFQADRGSVSAWLVAIARSRALDRARARRRHREEPWSGAGELLAAESLAGGGEGPLEAAELGERRELVMRAVAGLPEEQRKTVELAYFHGLSQTEIAERTGQPLGTVKTRARLALQKLRDVLAVLREEKG